MSVTLLSAIDQLALLRQHKISPLELAEEHILRIERLNPSLNAFIEFDPERVRAQARRAATGPLAGLPISLKVSIAARGYKCELGSVLRRGHISQHDSEAAAGLRAAGATLLGTTNCPELLMAYETDNLLYGKTSNPWNLDYSAGGSSGGEAAAIAAGMSTCGLGSDSGGSVRQPAHACGICSLKPTPGRVPARGHEPGCFGPFSILGVIGPMARTVSDVALLFRVLARHDPLDPASAPVDLRPVSPEGAKRTPIGWFEDDGLAPVTEQTRAAVRAAAQSLERQGFRVQPFRPQALEEARKLWWAFFVDCGAMFYSALIGTREGKREEELSPIFRDYLNTARADAPLTAETLLTAWAECDRLRAQIMAEMQQFPVLLLPVCAVPAFKHGERAWSVDGKEVQYWDAMRYTQWFNLLGAPAAVVPVGQSPEGLPIGVQIAGRPYADELVLAVAAAVERDFGYRAPPLAAQGKS
jgi:amidase